LDAPKRCQNEGSIDKWRGASDCFPAPRPSFWPLQIGMVAIRIGNGGLLHSISSHARPSVLPNALVCTMFWLASFCTLLSHSLALDYKINCCPPISWSLVYFGRHMHLLSALTALHLAGIRIPLNEYRCCPSLRTYDVLIAWTLSTSGSSTTLLSKSREADYWHQKQRRVKPNFSAPLSIATSLLFNTLNAISSLVVSKQPSSLLR